MKTWLALSLLILSFVASAEEIPYPFFDVQSGGKNEVMHITDGLAALKLRVDMIRRAQKSIELEYFIYNTDIAGKIITRELVAAAKRGVKVRLLIDRSLPIFKFNIFYASELKENGVEIKYYNVASFLRISSVQFRNHRKLLSVDDKEAITGGRNIGDDYFDLSDHFNFNDTDIYVAGPMAKTMRDSFDKYWEDEISADPSLYKMELYKDQEDQSKIAKEFFEESEKERKAREVMETLGQKRLSLVKTHACPELTFATDAPGGQFFKRITFEYRDDYRYLRQALFAKVSQIDKAILLSSPYMINNIQTKPLMEELLKKNVDITIYTNSLASTDAVYVASNLYLDLVRWRKQGIKIFLHDGLYLGDNPELDESIKKARWGTHSKVQVYETSKGSEVAIGTYNIDNRSNFYNSEMMLFCKGNEELTAEVKDTIMKWAHKGIEINEDGTATERDGTKKSIFGHSKKGLLTMRLIFLPSWLLKFLL